MSSAPEMMQMGPQMAGCCSFGFVGMAAGLVSMAKWPIAIAAIVYLLVKRPRVQDDLNEA